MPDDLREALQDLLARPPFHHWLGPVLEEVDAAGRGLTVRIPARPEFARWPGARGFHGGVLAAAVDVAAHAAVAILTRGPTPTVDLRVDYMRASSGTDLLARARIIRAGRSLATVRVEVEERRARLLAHGMATFYVRAD